VSGGTFSDWQISVDGYQRPNINPQEPGEGSRFLGFFAARKVRKQQISRFAPDDN
jgi:hypothetical protein